MDVTTTRAPYTHLVRYKQWADRGLYDVVARHLDGLDAQDAFIMLRVLDHIHVTDRIFQHHLQGLAHPFEAPRSETMPDFATLATGTREVDDWYVDWVERATPERLAQRIDFAFTNGSPGRMTRAEMLLHVCLHGTYHRGNAGIILQKNGIAPNDDRMTDFLEASA